MKNRQIILGVDPGSYITGYGLIEVKAGVVVPLDFGAIRPPQKAVKEQRYLVIFESIDQLIMQFKPTVLAVETQFVYKNVQTALKLGMACGAVLIAAARHQLPIFEYAPKRIKQSVVGQGSASKEQMQQMIQMQLGLSSLPEPFDAADALGIALCHAYHQESVYV
ncbi:MAG: crossover junction endodeoxyribonuclease RuvC [Candidatus Rhabdochlamydia sp.]